MGVDYLPGGYSVPTVPMAVCGRAGLSLSVFRELLMTAVERLVRVFRRAPRLSHARQTAALEEGGAALDRAVHSGRPVVRAVCGLGLRSQLVPNQQKRPALVLHRVHVFKTAIFTASVNRVRSQIQVLEGHLSQ